MGTAKGLYMDFKLVPERRLIMTLSLRQSLEVLQMPQLELAEWLHGEIERNPLLEFDRAYSSSGYFPELASTVTLQEHLLCQIRENFSLAEEQLIAKEFLEHLDERGFLSTPLDKIAALFAQPVEPILKVLQTFDPPGIFARNLQESLLLQLSAKGKTNSLPYKMVADCFDDLLHGRYASIKKKLTSANLTEAMQILSRLSLRPAHAFKQEPTTPAIADLRIDKIEGGWTLEICEEELPKFHLQSAYLDLEPASGEERELLRGLKTQAKWIVRSLDRRRKLLREIGRILLRKQAAYLNQTGPLTSLTIKELSEQLQVHESTISRALSGKHALTPRGLIPLRSLVSGAAATKTVQETLQGLIAEENKETPLTDDQLAQLLKAKGFLVARRTISKYRTKLKIGSAHQRKYT